MPRTIVPVALTLAAALILPVGAPERALAQPVEHRFDRLRARVAPGDTVYVTDRSGHRVKGRVAGITATTISLAQRGTLREFTEAMVASVERRRPDSIMNGIAIGAGVGAAVGAPAGAALDGGGPCRPGIECHQGRVIGAIGGAFWGAIIGGVTDALRHRREVVYEATPANGAAGSGPGPRFTAACPGASRGPEPHARRQSCG